MEFEVQDLNSKNNLHVIIDEINLNTYDIKAYTEKDLPILEFEITKFFIKEITKIIAQYAQKAEMNGSIFIWSLNTTKLYLKHEILYFFLTSNYFINSDIIVHNNNHIRISARVLEYDEQNGTYKIKSIKSVNRGKHILNILPYYFLNEKNIKERNEPTKVSVQYSYADNIWDGEKAEVVCICATEDNIQFEYLIRKSPEIDMLFRGLLEITTRSLDIEKK